MRFLIFFLITLSFITSQNLPLYCQAPYPNPTNDREGKRLIHVSVITRHGDRTPLHLVPGNSDVWYCNLATIYDLPSMENSNYIQNPNRLFRKAYLNGREVLKGNCSYGQLTELGLHQHQLLGTQFKYHYEIENHLINDTLDPEIFWVRTTDVPRTIQSAEAEISTLFPLKTQSRSSTPLVTMHTIDSNNENMYPPPTSSCPNLGKIEETISKTAKWQDMLKQTTRMQKKLSEILHVSENEVGDLGYLIDNLRARQCHKKDLPNGMDDELINEIQDIVNLEKKLKYTNSNYTFLAIGRFVNDIWNGIQSDLNHNTSFRYRYYSGHDSTVGPLSGSLGLFEKFAGGVWPPYASHLEIEIWESLNNSSNRFVQMKYNGIQSPKMIKFEEFSQFIQSRFPIDYEKACGI